MYQLSIETKISAAHFLRDYEGPCNRLHGHNWRLKVKVTASKLNEVGMAIDFKDLKEITLQVAERFEHRNLNEIPPFDQINPTAENMALHFYNEISKLLPENVKVKTVTVWENDTNQVEYGE
jgi:6-pyruvoyltetrahydropterin/6-carboxytetrahydropterin synthase